MNWNSLHQQPQALRERLYRLIDGLGEPHRHLDSCYPSLEAALEDAIAWLEHSALDPSEQAVGVEVDTASGDWRTLRRPEPLFCSWSR
ncbi:hypothetical protein [Vulcanococcus sp.]|jgi:hypothetical protein|uniref:hypothetical protein n=1 Tax=Vulcanococcus sp. TaxID=2856995 RepID=UPI00322AEDF9